MGLMVVVARVLPLCAVVLALPAIAATQPMTYFDDFSSYTPGQPPAGYLHRGASGAAPTVQEVGGSGPAYRRLSFPYVGGQSWDSWALKDGLTLQTPYVVTVKIRFQTSGDRGGVTIAWDDTNWDRVDIQPNIFWQNVEFRISYTGPNASSPVVTGPGLMSGGLPMQLGTDYWLQVEATSDGPGQGQVIVSWSTDGTTFTPVVTATGLAEVSGLAGMGTAGPNLPNVYFDDFLAEEEFDDFTYPIDLSQVVWSNGYDDNTPRPNDWNDCYDVAYNVPYHAGQDYGFPAIFIDGKWTNNTPVYAVADGIVHYSSKDPGTTKSYPGGVVILEHTLLDGKLIYSMYGHLDPNKILVSASTKEKKGNVITVTKGQQIATGLEPQVSVDKKTGEVTFDNTHLHWEMRYFYDGSEIKQAPKYKLPCATEPGPGYTYHPDDSLAHPDNFAGVIGKNKDGTLIYKMYHWTNPEEFVQTY